MVHDQGGAEFQPADILKYLGELKRGSKAEVGPKDIFEIASRNFYNHQQEKCSKVNDSFVLFFTAIILYKAAIQLYWYLHLTDTNKFFKTYDSHKIFEYVLFSEQFILDFKLAILL